MDRIKPIVWAVVFLGFLNGTTLWADVPLFDPQVTDVTVFKDGHALVMVQGSAQLEGGWCRTREVPAPLLGAFWTFVAQENCEVDFVRSGFIETDENRPCLTFEEMIQANAGKEAVIVEEPRSPAVQIVSDAGWFPYQNGLSHEGTLLGILSHETEKEVQTSETLPPGYDRWGRYVSGQQVQHAKEEKVESLASFVMLKTSAGVQLIKRENIRSICFAEDSISTEHPEKKKVREISIRVLRNGEPARGDAALGMVYLQRGIRWIPDYRIELLGNGEARVSLQGTIINELADLDNVDMRLVVGVPSFVMKDSFSPMALREIGLQLGSYFAPPAWRRGETRADYLSNALMSQVVAVLPRGEPEPSSGGPDVPSEGQQEDLFVYHKSGITLRKGERAVVKLLDVTVPYEDIYTWDVPALPPREMWRHVNQEQIRQLLTALGAPKVMHQIRLTNTGEVPWTTGPATIFKDGTPLGQQVLTYTSVKNKVDVPVTVATDLNTKKEESEASRNLRDIRLNGTDYTKVVVHGKLAVTNFKDRPVRLFVSRKIVGTATAATADGKITSLNVAEETSLLQEEQWWWYWWSWPWWFYRINSVSEISWEATIAPGKSAAFEYDWHYHCAP
jgi:hypothetical protein